MRVQVCNTSSGASLILMLQVFPRAPRVFPSSLMLPVRVQSGVQSWCSPGPDPKLLSSLAGSPPGLWWRWAWQPGAGSRLPGASGQRSGSKDPKEAGVPQGGVSGHQQNVWIFKDSVELRGCLRHTYSLSESRPDEISKRPSDPRRRSATGRWTDCVWVSEDTRWLRC